MHTICPWCDAEIAWDEEIGAEEVCPYCENELGTYRSVNVDWQQPAHESTPSVQQTLPATANDVSAWMSCSQCDEAMIHLGTQVMSDLTYRPRLWQHKPLLAAPLTLELFLCPSCDRVEQTLSLADKEKLLRLVNEHGE